MCLESLSLRINSFFVFVLQINGGYLYLHLVLYVKKQHTTHPFNIQSFINYKHCLKILVPFNHLIAKVDILSDIISHSLTYDSNEISTHKLLVDARCILIIINSVSKIYS